jgi:hypothetical protein
VPSARPFRDHDDRLDEGDVLANAPVLKWKNGEPKFTEGRVIVTAHGCACEDYYRALEEGRTSAARRVMVMVAPVRNANDLDEDTRQAIQRGEYYDLFYVYGDGSRLHDQVVDLTREFNVPASLLIECQKIARLNDWQWRRLLIALTVSRWHQKPETIFREPEQSEN